MNLLKKIFRFLSKEILPNNKESPADIFIKPDKTLENSIEFFEPITPQEIFRKSKGLKDFINKIDH